MPEGQVPLVPPTGPTSPATIPPQSNGLQLEGRVLAAIALKALEQTVPLLGSSSEEGQAIVRALQSLSKHFGQASGDLQRSEIQALTSKASPISQPSGGSPGGPMAAPGMGGLPQMIRQRQMGMGMAPPPMAA